MDGERIDKAKKLIFPRLSLPVLVYLTAADFGVQIIDEWFKDASFDDPGERVGICFPNPHAPHAYRIGEVFKKRGKEKLKKRPIPLLED